MNHYFIISFITDPNIAKVFHKFYPQLTSSSPITDDNFMFYIARLLPGDLKDRVKSKSSTKEADAYFLDNAISSAIECGDNEPFDILLSIMKTFEGTPLKTLAEEIKEEIETKGIKNNLSKTSESSIYVVIVSV